MAAYQLFTLPKQLNISSSFTLSAGAKAYFFQTGTTTPQDTYSDAALTTPHAHPVVADAAGVLPPIYLDPSLTYKLTLNTAADALIYTVDPVNDQVLSQAVIGGFLYPVSSAETAALLDEDDLNLAYEYSDLRRFKCSMTGAQDDSAHIANALAAAVASGGTGQVRHPGGSISHDSTITVPNGVTIYGDDRSKCEFLYTGTGSGWKNVNGPNSSGFANVYIHGLRFRASSNSNVGAAIELNAGGFSYYGVYDNWFTGKWKYGVILDGTEITSVERNLFDISGPSNQISIWVVNGSDRIGSQTAGFSNGIWITRNQVSQSGGIGLADDGGNCHLIVGNLFNECSVSARLAKVTNSQFCNNSMESSLQTGTENVLVTTTGAVSGAAKGACFGLTIHSCTFSQNMNSGGSCLRFAGTAFHTAIDVRACNFVDLFGRGSAIDITKLGGSFVGHNHDDGSGSMFHYDGLHTDADGNTLLPPQNGNATSVGISGPTHARTGGVHNFHGGITVASGAVVSKLLLGSKTIDWGNVADGGVSSTTVTVTGAVLGDGVVSVQMSIAVNSGMFLIGNVESADTVRVTLHNESGGAVDLASGTLSVVVGRFS